MFNLNDLNVRFVKWYQRKNMKIVSPLQTAHSDTIVKKANNTNVFLNVPKENQGHLQQNILKWNMVPQYWTHIRQLETLFREIDIPQNYELAP